MPDEQEVQRRLATDAIVDSTAARRVVVAGPGTGKTSLVKFAFRHETEPGSEPSGLALTFIRALKADMAREFATDLPEVRVFTFDGYCLYLMNVMPSAFGDAPEPYDLLPDLLAEDIGHLRNKGVGARSVSRAFHDLDDADGLLTEAIRLSEYYRAVSIEGCVHKVWSVLEGSSGNVPTYPLIVVDEYQDLSRLEVEALELLCHGSKTLFVGDDDQALYGFKPASEQHLRDLWRDVGVSRFSLPYCSRCTQVVVGAINDVARRGARQLGNRIERRFECFLSSTTKSKVGDSRRYPEIEHAVIPGSVVMRDALGRYLVERVRSIPAEDIAESHEEGYPTVLVVGGQPFLDWASKSLQDAYPQTRMPRSDRAVDPVTGYWLLHKDPASRLGWRILLRCYHNEAAAGSLIEALRTEADFVDAIPDEYRAKHLEFSSLVVRVGRKQVVTDEERRRLRRHLYPFPDALDWLERPRAGERRPDDEEGGAGAGVPGELGGVSIFCRSIIGSKGLSGGHVFVVGMCDEYLPQDPDGVTPEEVREFIVALSRARKQCHLVSFEGNGYRPSSLIDWIGQPINRRVFAG